MSLIGSFLPFILFDVHVLLESLKILLRDTHKPQWNNDFEMLLQHLKTFIAKVVTLTLPNTNHPLFNTVESSEIGTNCVFLQVHKKRKRILLQIN